MERRSGIVTLTTDFGTAASYVAEMKGVILGTAPQATLVDGTHDLPPYDVFAGAYALRNLVRAFPVGTVHLAVVDPGVGGPRLPLVVETVPGFLVGPDNGLFTHLLAADPAARAFEIADPDLGRADVRPTFHGRDLFAPAAAHLVQGVPPTRFGPEVPEPVRLSLPGPLSLPDGRLQVPVIQVDRFGNVILGLSRRELIALVGTDAAVRVRMEQAGRVVEVMRESYAGMPADQPCFLWNGADDLEIAVNRSHAADLLGLGPGDVVLLELRTAGAGTGRQP
jgi:S-adenosylmethionine hydrolase